MPEVRLEVAGKRGISAFRFRKIQPDESFTHFEDKPSFAEVDVLATPLSCRISSPARSTGSTWSTRSSRAPAVSRRWSKRCCRWAIWKAAEEESSVGEPQYEFLPSAESILDEVVPTSFKVKLFKCFLDAAVSEQIARMVAMKAATENADSMISQLSMAYNRARQGQITGELLEIIGGAEALNE